MVAEARAALPRDPRGQEGDGRWHARPAGLRLAAIGAPTLAMAGEEDVVIPRRERDASRLFHSRRQLELFPGAGHAFIAQEAQRASAVDSRVLRRFLTGSSEAGSFDRWLPAIPGPLCCRWRVCSRSRSPQPPGRRRERPAVARGPSSIAATSGAASRLALRRISRCRCDAPILLWERRGSPSRSVLAPTAGGPRWGRSWRWTGPRVRVDSGAVRALADRRAVRTAAAPPRARLLRPARDRTLEAIDCPAPADGADPGIDRDRRVRQPARPALRRLHHRRSRRGPRPVAQGARPRQDVLLRRLLRDAASARPTPSATRGRCAG